MLTFTVVGETTQSQSIVDDMDGHHGPTREGGCDVVEEPTVRDGEFYIDGADCVIRVDDTLFKVNLALNLMAYPTLSSCRQAAKIVGSLTSTLTYLLRCPLFVRRACMLTFFLCLL